MTDNRKSVKRAGGRPSLARAARLKDDILAVAAALFLQQGYGAVSIESVAKQAGISKRTFYNRFTHKAALFAAVVHYVTAQMRPKDALHLFEGEDLQTVLRQVAKAALQAAMSPNALALHRLLLAEALRFPELAAVMSASTIRQDAIDHIALFLERQIQTGTLQLKNPSFAAEQFLQLVMASPQRRALGLGNPMTAFELNAWAEDSVALFLDGCRTRGAL